MIFFNVGSNGSTSGASSNSSSNRAAILSAYAQVGGADCGAFKDVGKFRFVLLVEPFAFELPINHFGL